MWPISGLNCFFSGPKINKNTRQSADARQTPFCSCHLEPSRNLCCAADPTALSDILHRVLIKCFLIAYKKKKKLNYDNTKNCRTARRPVMPAIPAFHYSAKFEPVE